MLSQKQKYQAPSGQSPLLCLAVGVRGYERWRAGMRGLGGGRREGEVLWGSPELARVAIWGFLHFADVPAASGWEWSSNMENGVQTAPRSRREQQQGSLCVALVTGAWAVERPPAWVPTQLRGPECSSCVLEVLQSPGSEPWPNCFHPPRQECCDL